MNISQVTSLQEFAAKTNLEPRQISYLVRHLGMPALRNPANNRILGIHRRAAIGWMKKRRQDLAKQMRMMEQALQSLDESGK